MKTSQIPSILLLYLEIICLASPALSKSKVINLDYTNIVIFNQPVDQCGKMLEVEKTSLKEKIILIKLAIKSIDKSKPLDLKNCGCPDPIHRISVYLGFRVESKPNKLVRRFTFPILNENNNKEIKKTISLVSLRAKSDQFYEIDFDCGGA